MRLTGSAAMAFVVLSGGVASAADAPSARETFATPWPARAPCPHPAALSLDEWLRSDLVWSGADGAMSLTFAPQKPNKPARLARTFPGDRLVSVSVTVGALPDPPRRSWLLRLDCPDRSTVTWGPCVGDRCGVTAEYRVARVPKAWRTEHWTTPTRAPVPYDDWPDVHYSRFKQRIAWHKKGDAEIERQSLRLTRDIAADMRDALAAACVRGRCAEPLQVAERRLQAYLAARDARYTLFEHGKAYNHWNTGWVWDATAGGTTFKVDCGDIAESTQVFCSLELDVGDGLRVIYFPHNRAGSWMPYDVAVADRPDGDYDNPAGRISFDDGAPRGAARLVEIRGRALALEPAAAP
jgi:hypothetical protein